MDTDLNSNSDTIGIRELNNLAKRLQEKGLATPALFMLEMYKPLSGVLAAIGQVWQPLIYPLFKHVDYDQLVMILNDRKLLEDFLLELELVLASSK